MRALIWFRSDLRVEDNPALDEASRAADRGVLAVFLIPADQWREHDWGGNKVSFVLRNLAELATRLETLNVPLLIRNVPSFDNAAKALLQLANEHECDALYFNHEYEVNERRRDEKVRDAFEDAGLRIETFHDQTVIPPRDVRTKEDGPYKVYSPFRRRWEAMIDEGFDWQPRGLPRKQEVMPCRPDTVPVPASLDGFTFNEAIDALWPAGEAQAKRRLTTFVRDRITEYKDRRDLPSEDATSTLSPYLACGAISARLCLHAAVEANNGRLTTGNKGITTWISQIVWREFYRHITLCFPRVSMNRPFRTETESIEWLDDKQAFEAWQRGRTGFPIVDAGMRQLAQTGWMHNRLRMITAMFLTKDLFIDWRRGERHFMNHLVDGDLANNNGGWQWSASTGTDAAPYFRIFNPTSQSRKCDADGDFIRQYVPELARLDTKAIHDPSTLPPMVRESLDYPAPICDHAKAREHAIAAFKSL